MILIFPLSVLKRRFTLLQSKIINADGGNPGFSCELIDCGNSMECIAAEIYFASAGDTQNVITQFIREQRNRETKGYHSNKGISLKLHAVLALEER